MLDRVHDLYDELERRRLMLALKKERSARADRMRSLLDRISSASLADVRDWYGEKLADGTYSPAGDGGVGMIGIAPRSGGKLEHAFVPCDRENAFFSLNVNVTT